MSGFECTSSNLRKMLQILSPRRGRQAWHSVLFLPDQSNVRFALCIHWLAYDLWSNEFWQYFYSHPTWIFWSQTPLCTISAPSLSSPKSVRMLISLSSYLILILHLTIKCYYRKTIHTSTHLTSKIPATWPVLKMVLIVVSFTISVSISDFSKIIFCPFPFPLISKKISLELYPWNNEICLKN